MKYEISIQKSIFGIQCEKCGKDGELFDVQVCTDGKQKTYCLCKECTEQAQEMADRINRESESPEEQNEAQNHAERSAPDAQPARHNPSRQSHSSPDRASGKSKPKVKLIAIITLVLIAALAIFSVIMIVHSSQNNTTNVSNTYNGNSASDSKGDSKDGSTAGTPSATVKKYFDAVKYGDVDTAIGCFTPNTQAEWKLAMSLTGFLMKSTIEYSDSSTLLGGLIAYANTSEYSDYEFKITDERINGDNATVEVSVYIDSSFDGTTDIYLTKVYDEWYITEDAPTEEQLKMSAETGFNKADGPIFVKGDNKKFELVQYCVKNGDFKSVFNFNWRDKYVCSYGVETNCFKIAQQFSSDLSKFAVSWSEEGDGHVGYIDPEGNVTDVTQMIHQSGSGFAAKRIDDRHPLFTSDDKFCFADLQDKKLIYYDLEKREIVRTEDLKEIKYTELYYLTHEDNPNNGSSVIIKKLNIEIEYGADIILTQDAFLGLGVTKSGFDPSYYIEAWGPGVTSPREASYSAQTKYGIEEGYYSSNGKQITPETEFIIQTLATYENTVYFQAVKGTQYLFSMQYNNGSFTEPEQLVEIPSGFKLCFCEK